MKYNPEKHHRRSIRLQGYDYSRPGSYFITICTYNREQLYGKIVNEKMVLNEYGKMVEKCWMEIPVHFPHVELDVYVVMPDHLHGIIVITNMGLRNANVVGSQHAVNLHLMPQQNRCEQFGKPISGTIPTIIRSYKSAVTKQINQYRNTPGAPVWQRNYYEHIIRNGSALKHIRQYILNNPKNWETDENNH